MSPASLSGVELMGRSLVLYVSPFSPVERSPALLVFTCSPCQRAHLPNPDPLIGQKPVFLPPRSSAERSVPGRVSQKSTTRRAIGSSAVENEARIGLDQIRLEYNILPNRKETKTNSIKLRFDESSRSSLTRLCVLLSNSMFIFTPMNPLGSILGRRQRFRVRPRFLFRPILFYGTPFLEVDLWVTPGCCKRVIILSAG